MCWSTRRSPLYRAPATAHTHTTSTGIKVAQYHNIGAVPRMSPIKHIAHQLQVTTDEIIDTTFHTIGKILPSTKIIYTCLVVITIIATALLAIIIFLRCRPHVKLHERIGLLRNKRQTDTDNQKPSTSNTSYAKAISEEYKEKESSSYENISQIVT